ncbi:ficolin-1-like [Glandiceps talaboti]
MVNLFSSVILYSAVVILTTYAQRYYDCQDVYDDGNLLGGTYEIWPFLSPTPLVVFCDMNAVTGHAWTVIQRRIDGSEDFRRDWEEYRFGFGNAMSEHWLGNDNIHYLTTANGGPSKQYVLRIELTDWYGNSAYAEYSGFRIGQGYDNYPLVLDTFLGGTAGDSLSILNGIEFLAYGDTNIEHIRGGWWLPNGKCPVSNLNGAYVPVNYLDYASLNGIMWETWRGPYVSYKVAVIKVRPELSSENEAFLRQEDLYTLLNYFKVAI